MNGTDNEIRLFDGQWVNIVNANDCWEGHTKEEAVHEAVKMVEEAMALNIRDNLWPIRREFQRND